MIKSQEERGILYEREQDTIQEYITLMFCPLYVLLFLLKNLLLQFFLVHYNSWVLFSPKSSVNTDKTKF